MNISIIKSKLFSSRLFKDSFWALFGNAFGKGLTVLSGIIVARFLGKDLYGEFGILRNTLFIIAIFSTMGLGYSGTVFVSERKEKDPDSLYYLCRLIQKVTLCFSGIIACFVFLFSRQLALFLEDISLNSPIKLLAIIIVLNALTTTQIGILAGLKEFKGTARVNVISGIINFVFTCLLTWRKGFNGALIALLISQLVNCVLNSLLLSRVINKPDLPYQSQGLFKKVFLFSMPIALQEMTVSLAHWAITVFLLKLTDYGEVGLYTAGGQWMSVILFFPIALRNVILSYMSGSDSKEYRSMLLLKMVGLNLLVTVVPSFIVFLLKGSINTIYGPSFDNVGIVISIACLGASVNSVFSVFSSDLMAKKQNWRLLSINLIKEAFKFPLLYLFVVFGLKGAVSAYFSFAIAEMIAIILCIIFRNNQQLSVHS